MNQHLGFRLPNTTSLDLPPALHTSPREYFEWLDYEIRARFRQGRLAGGMTPCPVGFAWKEPVEPLDPSGAPASAEN